MIRTLRALFAVAVLAGSFTAFAQQPLDRIAAIVDEDIILQSELDRAVANIRGQYAGREAQLPPPDVLQRQVLERLILIRLQAARAASTGMRISDEEVDSAVANIARQNNMTIDQLRQQLSREGLSFGDFRSSLRDEIVVQRLRQRFAQRISVSDPEIDAALATQAGGNTQYRLAHILVGLPEGATAEQIATGQRKIEGIKALLDRGEMEFSAAAVRYSDSPNALEGGDLGWRSLDQIPTSFAGTIRTMETGQFIGPIRGPSGFQLIRLQEVRNTEAGGGAMVTQYQARHILIRTAEDGSDDAAVKARLETLRARVAGGADFAQLAAQNSQDTGSKDSGGDLGWFARDDFGPDFGGQVAALGDGQVSAPFKTQAGWHIVQRLATRESNVGNENRRGQIRESIGQRKLEDEWNRFLREMRGEAFIDIRVGRQPGQAG
jgi:peptidyl-prolyl cis-trans isomerase SurA